MTNRGLAVDRRSVLRTVGALSAGGVVGLAGCGSGGTVNGDGSDGDAPTGSDYPALDDWLTESSVGGPDDTYDGTLVDRRGTETVTVDVGAAGNGGNFAFGPSALIVSAGTDVVWEWTGQGGVHNVVADPDNQVGEPVYAFASGDPTDGEGTEFSQSLAEPGVVRYHCGPHVALGMKGAIVVE